MTILKGHRSPVDFDIAFPQGLLLMDEIAPDNKYQSREDRAVGKPVRKKVDEATHKRQWKGTVTDPAEPNAKRTSFEVVFLADKQPAPATSEVVPGARLIELDGVTAEQKVAGNGEFKYQSYTFRATGFTTAAANKPVWSSGTVAAPSLPARPRELVMGQPRLPGPSIYLDPINLLVTIPPARQCHRQIAVFCRRLAGAAGHLANTLDSLGGA